MWKTSSFSISLLLWVQVGCRAQSDSGVARYGLRVGLDLSRFVMDYLQPNRRDLGFSADLQVAQNLFVAGEGGWATGSISNTPVFDYRESGYFWKIGADYNLLPHDQPGENNIIYGGLRIGHSDFNQSASGFQISDGYWGNVNGSLPLRRESATWLEVLAGMKIEALKNFFIGWSVRERILFRSVVDPVLTPYVIPGFGKGSAASAFDVDYSIYYRIPILKIRVRPKLPNPPPPVPGHRSPG